MSIDPESAVAIVGVAGRFPGAGSVGALWDNLAAGVRSIRPLSDAELRALAPEALADPAFVPVTADVADAEYFDAEFFGFTDDEAAAMDPQNRLFLECVWEAMEDAGHDPMGPGLPVGLFAGCGFPSYLARLGGRKGAAEAPELRRESERMRYAVGNDRDSLCSMVSYKLDLRGPSIAVQTFSSSALTSVHLACQSLLGYETDLALAGGVAVHTPQATGYRYDEAGTQSPDGACRSFDAESRGTVIGNGLGVVALKRLADAHADGDHVYAAILGTAVNCDGGARAGYAAPGRGGKARVAAEALANAGVSAAEVDYVEALGLGVMVIDTIELNALAQVYAPGRTAPRSCPVGTLKPNMGHLEHASGIASLIKTALMLDRRTLLPTIGHTAPNAALAAPDGPFRLQTEVEPWRRHGGQPRRAAVNSFGIGGTNAHAVLQEAPEPPRRPAPRTGAPHLLAVSARTPGALEEAVARLRTHLELCPEAELRDVAHTLRTGRTPFVYRRIAVCRSVPDAVAALTGDDPGRTAAAAAAPGEVVLRFGTAAAPLGDDADLRADVPAFAAAVEECAAAAPAGAADAGPQAAAFVAQYALGRALAALGAPPRLVTGRGVGHLATACLAGAMPLSEALAAARIGGPVPPDGQEAAKPEDVVVEVGADTAVPGAVPAFGPGLCRTQGTRFALAELAGRLWLAGLRLDWSGLPGDGPGRRTPLPTYPFQRRRHWID
ncbi:acyl transferase domain-containing protein [Nocardiopsis mwathae]|uniref:Acyl transferase domain-containing protein n=1 Tax=Nocardiopsis mwathae TaxID=1472723 RepID=A0A7W9YGU5_9ACTN|nr:polyketide synthase [Nocardiopsis mwathae]MBB6171868.1 acyl transferase domain-containing protein [Nocardiopsis mwathae]